MQAMITILLSYPTVPSPTQRKGEESKVVCVYAQQHNFQPCDLSPSLLLASFPGLPCFSRSSASIQHYTERKPKNENGGGLGTRLVCCSVVL